MSAKPFGLFLPYWSTLQVGVRQSGSLPAQKVAVMVLKDGTLAVALRVSGLEIYGDSAAQINAQMATMCQALDTIPAGGYLQAVFESRLNFKPLLKGFAGQNAASPYALLRRGRTARQQDLEQRPFLGRCQITYWIGWKDALGALAPEPITGFFKRRQRSSGASQSAQMVRLATQQLVDSVERFVGVMAASGISMRFLQESEMLADCHRAINPTAPPSLKPPLFIETEDDIRDYAAGKPYLLRGASLSSQLPLSVLRCNDTQLFLGEPPRLYRALGVTRWPPTTNPQILFRALYPEGESCPDRIVVTHQATDRMQHKESLARRQRMISNFIGRGFVDQDVKQALVEHECVLEEMATRDARVFKTSAVILVSGADEYELDKATRGLSTALNRHQTAVGPFYGQQLAAWQGSLPGYGYHTPNAVPLMDRSCAHLTPYWLPSTGSEHPDILMENRQNSLEALSVRLGPERADAGAVIVGKTGSGKTFLFSHLFKYGCLDLGGHVIIVDNKGPVNSSYRPLCELLGGSYISLQGDENIAFNPFPPCAELFDAHFDVKVGAEAQGDGLEALERILCMIVWRDIGEDDASAFRRAVAREVIILAYRSKQDTGEAVILGDICTVLRSYQPTLLGLVPHATQMLERLQVWLQSPKHARLFNRPHALDTSNPFTVFDFAGMDDDPALAAVLISVLSTRIEAKMASLPKSTPKLFAFDEAWAMFSHSAQACSLLSRLYRVSRSFGAFCYVLTQSYDDIASSKASSGILSNTSLVYLMTHVDKHAETSELFRLSPRQQELFRGLQKVDGAFAEFLLVDRSADRTHVLRYAPTPWDLWCDTSKSVDVEFRDTLQKSSGNSLEDVIAHLAEAYPQGAPSPLWASKESAA